MFKIAGPIQGNPGFPSLQGERKYWLEKLGVCEIRGENAVPTSDTDSKKKKMVRDTAGFHV